MRRHFALALILAASFALADAARSVGLPVAGAALDVVKLLACAALLVAAWRAGLRVLAVVGVLLFSITACAPLEWARPDATIDETRLARFCMEARGYSLRAVAR